MRQGLPDLRRGWGRGASTREDATLCLFVSEVNSFDVYCLFIVAGQIAIGIYILFSEWGLSG